MDQIMTLEEVSDYLRISEKTVKEWVNKGELPGGKLGTSWRFRREDIEQWVRRQLAPARSPDYPKGYSMQALLRRDRVFLLEASSKTELLNALIDAASDLDGVASRAQLADAVFSREELMSTGIGLSVGVPHARLPGIKHVSLFLARNRTPIEDYESLDGAPVQLVVFILAGKAQHREHLKALASISKLMKNKLVREQLLRAKNADAIYELVLEAERAHE